MSMKELEARKKLLVAESEVYRQTLRLDVQNLRLCSIQMQRKYATYMALKPALMVALPLVGSIFSGKARSEKRPRSLISTAIAGWRMYKNFQPLIASLLAQYAPSLVPRNEAAELEPEDETPAAAI